MHIITWHIHNEYECVRCFHDTSRFVVGTDCHRKFKIKINESLTYCAAQLQLKPFEMFTLNEKRGEFSFLRFSLYNPNWELIFFPCVYLIKYFAQTFCTGSTWLLYLNATNVSVKCSCVCVCVCLSLWGYNKRQLNKIHSANADVCVCNGNYLWAMHILATYFQFSYIREYFWSIFFCGAIFCLHTHCDSRLPLPTAKMDW